MSKESPFGSTTEKSPNGDDLVAAARALSDGEIDRMIDDLRGHGGKRGSRRPLSEAEVRVLGTLQVERLRRVSAKASALASISSSPVSGSGEG